jgi:hypothetical protein
VLSGARNYLQFPARRRMESCVNTGRRVVDGADQLRIVSSGGEQVKPSGRNRPVYVFETDSGVVSYPVGKLRVACPQP